MITATSVPIGIRFSGYFGNESPRIALHNLSVR